MRKERCDTCCQFLNKCECELVTCANCGKQFKQSPYAGLADAIMKHEPACSTECREVANN